jgi:hypothetical protein
MIIQCVGLQVTRQILMQLEFSRHIFEKFSNIKFHKNLSSGSRGIPCGRTDTTKLTVTIRNFANALKSVCKQTSFP